MQTSVTRQMLLQRLADMQRRALDRQPPPTGTAKQAVVCSERDLVACGVFARYHTASFEQIERRGVPPVLRRQVDSVREYADQLDANLRAGVGLLLRGPAGTLKTTLAVATLQRCLLSGRHAVFLTAASLVDAIFAAQALPDGGRAAWEEKLRCVPLLVLDDLGAEWSAGWTLSKLDAIIAERYNRRHSLLITTNLGTDEMKRRYPARIIDRLRETCRIITMNAPGSLRPTCE